MDRDVLVCLNHELYGNKREQIQIGGQPNI
jgi:hypothetical protein